MVLARDIQYHLICLPDTRDVEAAINQLLKENPEWDVEFPPFQVAERHARGNETNCPKCGHGLIANKAPPIPYVCEGCKRIFSQEDFDRLTKTTYTRAGNFYIQPVILKKEGKD